MIEVLVMANQHANLIVVNTDVGLYHGFWNLIARPDIPIQKVEHHHRIIHGGLAILFHRETIVVKPWLHVTNQLFYRMIERANSRIISKQRPHFFLCKSYQFIKLMTQRIISAYIEATRQIVHRYRTHTCDKDTCQRRRSGILHGIEEHSKISFAMSLLTIPDHVLRLSKNLVGEMIILINEKIDMLVYILTFCSQELQLIHASLALLFHPNDNIIGQIRFVSVAEIHDTNIDTGIQTSPIVIKSGIHCGKVEWKNQIGVALGRRILADIQSAKELIKLLLLIDIVIILEHRDGKALAESARANEEEEHIGFLY